MLPAGSAKIGTREYRVSLNSSPDAVAALNDLPVKVVNGATVYMRDVAHVRDGFAVQTNIVRQDGRRSALLTDPQERQRLDARRSSSSVKQLLPTHPGHRAAGPRRSRSSSISRSSCAPPSTGVRHGRRRSPRCLTGAR